MPRDATDVVTKLPPPNGWQGWPTGIQTAVKLGVSVKRLRVLVQTGNITCYPCPDRTNRYDPDQIEALERDLRIVSKRKLEDDDPDEIDELEDEPRKPSQAEDLNKTLVAALKNANDMVLEMHKLLTAGAKIQADTQDKVIGRLLEREEAREKAITDVYLAREAYFNQQVERDLLAKRANAVEARRAEMWTITKGHLDKLVDVAYAKLGIPKEVLAKIEPAIQLLQKLDTRQLQLLIGSGFLSKEQEELVGKIVNTVPEPDVTDAKRVAQECEEILQKQKAAEREAQAAQEAQANAERERQAAAAASKTVPANETKPADDAGDAGAEPATPIESEKPNA